MEVFAKCARCGAMVCPCDARETSVGTRMRFWMAATTCTVDTDGGMALDLGGAAVLCPDCMRQYRDWLAEAPGKGADGDGVERLAYDLAKAVLSAMTGGEDGNGMTACRYFGHSGASCSGCPAYAPTGMTCAEFAPMHLRRRCDALGIGLEGGEEDAGR